MNLIRKGHGHKHRGVVGIESAKAQGDQPGRGRSSADGRACAALRPARTRAPRARLDRRRRRLRCRRNRSGRDLYEIRSADRGRATLRRSQGGRARPRRGGRDRTQR